MDRTIKIREAIRSFMSTNSRWITIVARGLVALFSFIIINHYFGYIAFFTHPIVVIIMSLSCAFMPISAGGLLTLIYIFVQLTGLSAQVALVALVIMIVSYGVSIFYGSSHMFDIDYIPVALQISMPYPLVVLSALFGKINDIVAVISGAVFSYYLKTIRENATLFIEDEATTSVIDVISKRMILNPMFYVYLVAIIALFIIIILIKDSTVKRAYLVALSSGIFIETIIMMFGYIISGNISKVLMLIVSNVAAYIVGIFITYIYRDIDYERIERVTFEDDDYIYYVTAVPKIGLAKEEKKIARITGTDKSYYNLGTVVDDIDPDEDED